MFFLIKLQGRRVQNEYQILRCEGYLPMKPRYYKMDDVSYPRRILHRYMFDTFRYVSGEYPKIKFYFLKK